MELEHDGIALWYGTEDAPVPAGAVAPDRAIAITLGVRPADASNAVEVLYRVGDGPTMRVPAVWLRNDPASNSQYFRAMLPPFRMGERVKYGAVCRCAGRQVPGRSDAQTLPCSFAIEEDAPVLDETTSIEMPHRENREVPLRIALAGEALGASPGAGVGSREAVLGRVIVPPEFDRLVERVSGHLEAVGVDELTPELAAEVASRTGLEAQVVETVMAATRRARETGVPPDVLYALAAQDVPLRDPVQPSEAGLVEDVLRRAVEQNVIAPDFRLSPAELAIRLSHAPESLGTLEHSVAALSDGVSSRLAEALAERGILTLQDVLENESVVEKGGHGDRDDPALRKLEAYARLSILPTDPLTNGSLLAAGFSSVDEIASTPGDLFLSALTPTVEPRRAASIYAAAAAQSGLLMNALTEARIDALTEARIETASRSTASVSAPLGVADDAGCACEECRNAMGPLAYLTQLLDYGVRQLRKDGAPLDLAALEGRLGQPLRDLPASCETVSEQVRRVRLVIEALRRRLPPNLSGWTPPWYLEAAYTRLLGLHGTSFRELQRVARGSNDRERVRLAQRLMLELPANRVGPDQLDELLRDPAAPGGIVEDWLWQVFGLRSTTADPLAGELLPGLFVWRRAMLESAWRKSDVSATPPLGGRPVVDPDLVRRADLRDPQPSPLPRATRPKTQWRPIDFLEERERWVTQTLLNIQESREAPNGGFEVLITDRDPIRNLPLGVGLGISVADFEKLRSRGAAGENISAELAGIAVSESGFDVLTGVWELLRATPPGTIFGHEWSDVYSILAQRQKQLQFVTWRQEEEAAGVLLGPDQFRVERADLEVQPRVLNRWRADEGMRRRWEDTLRARVEQLDAVRAQLDEAVVEIEVALLPELRNELVRLSAPKRPAALTRQLQIDVEADPCQLTTRVAQAIESVQGLLFGARNGLLDDASLTIADRYFDATWEWLGSYPTWRAAMSVFLYPETALRPTLRRIRSHAFDRLAQELGASQQVSPADAQVAAAEYGRYLDDLSSLELVAIQEVAPAPVSTGTGSATSPDGQRWPFLAIARGASSKLYFAGMARLPEWWMEGDPEQAPWAEVSGVPAGGDVVGVLAYRPTGGELALGLYVAAGEGSSRSLMFAASHGAGWTVTQIGALPDLVRVAEYRSAGVPAAGGTAISPWKPRGDDRVVALVAEGYGSRRRQAIAVVAAPAAQPRTRVGLLHAGEGGLVTTHNETIEGRWEVAGGLRPVVLRHGGVERILLTRADGASTQLGLLAPRWPAGPGLELRGATTDGRVYSEDGATSWKVNPQALFTAVDADGDGASELVAAEVTQAGAGTTKLTIMRADAFGLRLLAQQNVEHTGLVDSSLKYPVLVEAIVAVRIGGLQENLAVIGQGNQQVAANGASLVEPRHAVWELDWDSTTRRFDFRQGSKPALRAPALALHADDQLLPIDLGTGGRQAVALFGPSRDGIAILTRGADGSLTSVWQATSGVIDPTPGAAAGWLERPGDQLVAVDLDDDGRHELVILRADGSELGVLAADPSGQLRVRSVARGRVKDPHAGTTGGWTLVPGSRYIGADVGGRAVVLAQAGDGRLGLLRPIEAPRPLDLVYFKEVRLRSVEARSVVDRSSADWRPERASQIRAAYHSNGTASRRRMLDEAYYFVPLEIALRLQQAGAFTAALDWYRSVYDYERPRADRKIAHKLVLDGQVSPDFEQASEWLRDPLNPHAIADVRRDSYTRFTVLSIARCLVEAADSEFTRATAESLARARALYVRALDLLAEPEVAQRLDACSELIGRLTLEVGEDEEREIYHDLTRRLATITILPRLAKAVEAVEAALATDEPVGTRLALAWRIADEAASAPAEAETISATLDRDGDLQRAGARAMLLDRATARLAARTGASIAPDDDLERPGALLFWERAVAASREAEIVGWWELVKVLAPSFSFCVPTNPVFLATRRHAESNLQKLRTCRNIAGLELHVEPYAAPTVLDTGADGLPAPRSRMLRPLPYRYATLVERTKQLTEIARQLEGSMLSFLESADRARYELFKARQDLALAQASVHTRELQVAEVNSGIGLAQLQLQRATSESRHYDDLLRSPLSALEHASLAALATATTLEFAGIYAPETIIEWAGAAAPGFARLGETLSTQASYERREQEWRHQHRLSTQDEQIASAQVRLQQDRARIATQDLFVASLQADQADAIVEFLAAKRFGTAALYDWMSGVLAQIYRFFLQEATTLARLAEAQLAFERQQLPPRFIQVDYWEPPSSGMTTDLAPPADGSDRTSRGLTGSARLLRDVYALDEYAFRTNQRKLHLTETIPLSKLDPFAFQRFRETGLLVFSTPLSLFDQRFPGHYLRLVRRVRTSVIALIPPVAGIRATLSTVGSSRVVLGPPAHRTVVVQRGPESVALTAPMNATGVFELDPQAELLVPFEGIGVDTTWEFRLPKPANPWDYGSIADVLVAIDYTALDSPGYREQVIEGLARTVIFDRGFSFRHHFPDAWYHLHNPQQDEEARQMVVRVPVADDDFPPNLERPLLIRRVVLYFANRKAPAAPVPVSHLLLDDGAAQYLGDEAATDPQGVISTRRPGNPWAAVFPGQNPVGQWELSLRFGNPARDAAVRSRFQSGEFDDILLVLTCEGRTPAWPA